MLIKKKQIKKEELRARNITYRKMINEKINICYIFTVLTNFVNIDNNRDRNIC